MTMSANHQRVYTRWPKPRPAHRPPAGKFMYNGEGRCDFIQSPRFLWQAQPFTGQWRVIDGPQQ